MGFTRLFVRVSPFMPKWNAPPLSIRRIHFEFKGCWQVCSDFIQILKEHSVSKQCST